ncbi:MAG: hypothetical protein DNFNHJIP_00175 [Candidatus Argoarchaeum ethanivorans]|uniref:Uncharacterized protein n=1 Tax=Candidatus Argoarchaeum ethanivorans TaxID=2608793 RepID=A0A812A1U2_9EURY|nr:MAG: hypothetical protein DNFNHJIP_00175 [Candidatus Argoarchaeum ethanivorans]
MKMMQAQTKSPEEIMHLFDKKEIDNDWSFAGLKPSDTGKWTHNYRRYPVIYCNRAKKVNIMKFEDLKSLYLKKEEHLRSKT